MKLYVLLLTLGCLVVGCHSGGMRVAEEYRGNQYGNYTQGRNEAGRRFTSFATDNSLGDLQTLIEKDTVLVPRAMITGQSIEWTKFVPHYLSESVVEKFEIQIKWKGKNKFQTFRGQRQLHEGQVSARLEPVDAGESYSLEVSCAAFAEMECGKSVAVILMGEKIIGGIEYVRQEKRMSLLASPALDSSTLSPKAKALYEQLRKGESVTARSFSVVYGRSAVDIFQKSSQGFKLLISTDLLDPDGDVLPVYSAAPLLSEVGSTTLVGNNTSGSLFFLQGDRATNKEFAFVVADEAPVTRTSPGSNPPSNTAGNCDVADKKPAVAMAKSVIDEVISTCDKKTMAQHREFWRRRSPETVRKLISTYRQASTNPTTDLTTRMNSAITEIRAAQLPVVMLGVTLVESSGFNPNAVSYVGATSEWQIMPCTAKFLGILEIKVGGNCNRPADITFDGRKDSSLAARAMAKYIKSFFAQWGYTDPIVREIRHNLPMALASYIAPKRAKDASKAAIERINHPSRAQSLGPMTAEQKRLFPSDFFFLAENHIGLIEDQIDYTYKILSGMQVILDPKSHGFSDLPPIAGN